MALFADYNAWIAGIRDWIGSDEYSDTQISTFLSMAQLRLNRELNAYWMEDRADVVITASMALGGFIPIIANIPDFNKVRLVTPYQSAPGVQGAPAAYAAAINEFKALTASDCSALRPLYYTIDADKLYIYPFPAENVQVEVLYYSAVPELSSQLPENVFSKYYADILLIAACLEAAPYQVEDERVQMWEQKYEALKQVYNAVSGRIKMGSTPLRREINVGIPT